jgi:magnesium-transporting ATPase (P-type)
MGLNLIYLELIPLVSILFALQLDTNPFKLQHQREIPMFSSLTRNAVNTVLLVCKNQHNGPVTTLSISKRLGLSISYLEALLSKLKKCGFVVSYRGPGGGYCSNGKPSELKLIDIILIAVPPALPVSMTFGIIYALERLNKKKIFGA